MSIDRRRLVGRHNPVLRAFDSRSPLSVGNGEIAFTVDCTGLQTFRRIYDAGTPLCTQSQWGWHSFPGAESEPALRLKPYDAGGRSVGYATSAVGQEPIFDRLRRNPHRLNLGAIGFRLHRPGHGTPRAEEIQDVRQELDLWSGRIESLWTLWGSRVAVRTSCHPDRAAIAVDVQSALCSQGFLSVEIVFPYGSPDMNASDWSSPGKHRSEPSACPGGTRILRTLDATRYSCAVFPGSSARLERSGEHAFVVQSGPGQQRLSVVLELEPGDSVPVPMTAGEVETDSARRWQAFWLEGGCIECAGSPDPRAVELERRIVLSQYLTAIQCAGSLPPQETGLTCNSWYGKFHLEMHYWHAAHFALWGRTPLLERSMGYYARILDSARHRAREQGYEGARWPKMVGPEGADSPSPIGPLLAWQQPHPIMLAELIRRAEPGGSAIQRYAEVVFAGADFMASFARREEAGSAAGVDRAAGRFILGPPLVPAQENHAPEVTLNPTYELEYWDFGLRTANEWRQRLGLPEDQRWKEVADGLADLPSAGGVYIAHERCPDTFGAFAEDHPSMLAALGVLPGRKADPATMNRTFDRVLRSWRLESMWGWDFPMMAMTAARLARPRDALDVLLMESPKNTWLPNGHNPQVPRKDLPLYLPANGGLLLAIALMAAGAAGFPDDGTWTVTAEGILPPP
jgi:hypothetical protein